MGGHEICYEKKICSPTLPSENQKKFRKLIQDNMTVEKYYDEFEILSGRLELNETKESLMAQFVDGLQEIISRKVERQPYH